MCTHILFPALPRPFSPSPTSTNHPFVWSGNETLRFLGAKDRAGPKRVVVVVVVGSPITSGSKEIERTDAKKERKKEKDAAERRRGLRKTIYVFAMESTSNTQYSDDSFPSRLPVDIS